MTVLVRFKKNSILACLLITMTLIFFITVMPVPRGIYFYFNPDLSISCFRVKTNTLKEISDVTPKKDRSIFFHETSCRSHRSGKIVLSPRQACAVESAAKVHPDYDVYLLFASPGVLKFENTESDRVIQALLTYKNIKLLHLNYERYTNDTPVEELYKTGQIDYSDFALSHSSDVLRYLTLYKYGGIYLDLDVVVLKPLTPLKTNYAGVESDRNVAAGILSFSSSGLGHYFAKECILDLANNFKGDEWGYNGPGVISRLMKKLCDVEQAKDMINKDCNGFKAYAKEYFYAVPWWNWTMFFDPSRYEDVKTITKNSFILHLWNQFSIHKKLPKDSKAAYSVVASKYCPKVYDECDKYF